MKKNYLALAVILALALLATGVLASDEQTVTCSWGPGQLGDGATVGQDSEENSSVTFQVRCDNETVTISSVVVILDKGAGDLGSSLTLLNGTNTSYYEATFEGFPDAGYRIYATATFVNTTNSTSFVDSNDVINLTSLSSTTTTLNLNVDTGQGSNVPQKTVAAEKKTNNMGIVALVIVIIVIIAVFVIDSKGGK